MKSYLACLFAAVFLAAGLAEAHHSLMATYDLDKEVPIHGAVVEFLLRNPHSFLVVEARDENGKVLHWNLEWGAGGQLTQGGIRRDTVKAGDQVEIAIYPGRQPEEHRGLVKILRRPSDGFEWGTKPGEIEQNWWMGNAAGRGVQ